MNTFSLIRLIRGNRQAWQVRHAEMDNMTMQLAMKSRGGHREVARVAETHQRPARYGNRWAFGYATAEGSRRVRSPGTAPSAMMPRPCPAPVSPPHP
jgi:hypothetical protein